MKQDKRKKFYYFILLINNDFARHFEKSPKRDMTSYWHEDFEDFRNKKNEYHF